MKRHDRVVKAVGGLLAFALLAGGSGSAAAAAPANLSAEQIVERNIAARGGSDAWREVKSIAFTGQMDAGQVHPNPGPEITDQRELKIHVKRNHPEKLEAPKNVALPFRLELKRPHKTRLEVQFQGQTAVQVYDGQVGYKYRPYLNRTDWQSFTPEEARLASDQQELDGPLLDYRAKGTRIALDGTDKVDDRDAYRLKLTLANGEVRHVWVDAQNFLDVKIDGQRRMDGREKTMFTVQKDFRKVNGVTVPFLLETSVEGINRVESIHVEKAELNPRLDDARFVRPSG